MAGRSDHHRFRRWGPILCGMLVAGWPVGAPAQPPHSRRHSRGSRGLRRMHHARGRTGAAAPPDGGPAQEDARPRARPPARVRTVQKLSTQVDQLSTRLRQAEARRPASLNGTRAGPGMAAGSAGMPPGAPAATLGAAGPDEDVAEEVGFGPDGHGLRAGGRAAVAPLRHALRAAQHRGAGTVRPRVPDPVARRRVRHPVPQPDRAHGRFTASATRRPSPTPSTSPASGSSSTAT